MTNEELKALAEAATPGPWQTELTYPIVQPAYPARGAICSALTWPDARFIAAANPAAVLGLIESEQEATELGDDLSVLLYGIAIVVRDPEEPKIQCRFKDLPSRVKTVVEERDALKAECEGLRKDAERANYWKQRAKSAEGHLFAGDLRAAALELHRYSRFESTPWPELTDQQRALICGAAGAVIGCVNAVRAARKPKDGADAGETVWCACGDGHAANSYGAGFMAANGGVCENCDAANGSVEPDLDTPDEMAALRKDAERLEKATAFVQQLCDAAGKQPSVATGYLHDILGAMGRGGQSND